MSFGKRKNNNSFFLCSIINKTNAMENLPVYVAIIFGFATCLTLYLFYKAANNSKIVFLSAVVWLIIQAIIASTGFYTKTGTVPPRLMLAVLPPLILIIIGFAFKQGRNFIDRLDTARLTFLHIVRIPVEVVLLFLFLNKTVPGIMTFEGRNFDILSGLTAPLIWYFGYARKKLNVKIILLWNFCCLILLFNVVITAILSIPFNFQQFAFDQPNIAVLYYPYVWLPCFIVPVVLFSHLVSIRKIVLTMQKNGKMAFAC